MRKRARIHSLASSPRAFTPRTHTSTGRERYATEQVAFPSIKETGLKSFHNYLKQIDAKLEGREWVSDKYSVLDPYAFVIYTWGVRRELPVKELKNYTAHKDRMMKRPKVGFVLEDEKISI